MIERRSLLGGMAALGLLASLAAHGQPPRGRFRIGVLAIGTPEGATAVTDTFNQAMRELGYVEGTNVVYEYRWAPGAPDRLPGFADELVQTVPSR